MPALTADRRAALRPWLGSALLTPLAIYFALDDPVRDPSALSVLVHSWNLIVHEAGHFFFRFFGALGEFGTFVHVAGGTILQLGLPALFVWQSVVWDSLLGAQLSLLLLGQNAVDVSIYASDAQARALPLLGNLPAESHDWWNLLSMTGLLEHTPAVAGVIYALAFPCWIAMVLAPKRLG